MNNNPKTAAIDISHLKGEYFDWMYGLVFDTGGPSYRRLLRHLHTIPFRYNIAMDGNRAEDGIDLRYRFGHECGHSEAEIALYLDDRDCSVLEMMIALAIRCEEHIMDDPDIGNRTGKWFTDMLVSLGLRIIDGDHVVLDSIDDSVSRFLNGEYDKNGRGGLFTVRNDNIDMRSMEIWYQMCWYLNEVVAND